MANDLENRGNIPPIFSWDTGSDTPAEGSTPAAIAGEAAILAAKEGRRPRSDKGQSRGPRSTASGTRGSQPSPTLQAEISRQLEAAYDPKAWAALLTLPATVALTLTGHKHWDVSKDESETMGACGSVAARFLMVESPKTLALLMLSSALFGVYVPRIIEELKLRRIVAQKEPEKKANDLA